jgi:hypothetical protein
MLNRHLDWEARYHYLQLLEEFMKEKIDIYEFCSTFCERGLLSSEVVGILKSNWILLSPHENPLKFSDLLDEIFDYCEVRNGDPEPFREEHRLNDVKFLILSSSNVKGN